MKAKLFEVRDSATFVPVLAVALDHENKREAYLLRRTGYVVASGPYVVLTRLVGGKSTYDPYDWGDRTMTVAHDHILKNFDALETGAVVDVEYILGERAAPKASESETSG